MTAKCLIAAAALAAILAGPALAARSLDPQNAQRSYGAGVVTEGGLLFGVQFWL
jgi:hypothetical protein